jgi:uncharacterized delta-60 repeat protein
MRSFIRARIIAVWMCAQVSLAAAAGFVVRHDGPAGAEDQTQAIAISSSGRLVLVGSVTGNSTLDDAITLCYSTTGTLLWSTAYNGPDSLEDQALALVPLPNDETFVVARSRSFAGYYDCVALRYSSAGALLWQQRYDGPHHLWDAPAAAARDSSGNLIVVGASYDTTSKFDFLVLKYSSTGTLLWSRTYDSPRHGFDIAVATVVDGAGNIYLTGFCDNSLGKPDVALQKYGPTGTLLWTTFYDGPGHDADMPADLRLDASGDLIVTGASVGVGTSCDAFTARYTSAGTQSWIARYNGPGNDWDGGSAIAFDATGNILVTGVATGVSGDYDILTLSYSSAGALQWGHTYPGAGEDWDEGDAISVAPSGDVMVGGTLARDSLDTDITTLTYSSTGTLKARRTYNGPGHGMDLTAGMVIDPTGGIFVGGSSDAANSLSDLVLLKDDSLGISVDAPGGAGPPVAFRIRSAFPNPSHGSARLVLEIPASAELTVRIFDLQGRLVRTVADKRTFAPGIYELPLEVGETPGVMFYRVTGRVGANPVDRAARIVTLH